MRSPDTRIRLALGPDGGASAAAELGWNGGSPGATSGAGAHARTASLNTVISTGGVAVGVTALIVVLGVMNGLRDDLRERILVANPHLRVLTFGSGLRLDDWRERHRRRCGRSRGHRGRSGGDQPGGHHRWPRLRRGRQPARASIPIPERGRSPRCPQAITKGDLSFKTTKPGVDGGVLLGSRLASRLSVYPGRHRHPGAGHPSEDQPGAGRGGAPVLEIRGHRSVRYRHVSIRQPIRGHVAGDGPAVHRPGRGGIRHRGAGG